MVDKDEAPCSPGIKLTMMISNLISLCAFMMFFLPYKGAQSVAYGALIFSVLIQGFVIIRSVSLRNRGKHEGMRTLIAEVTSNSMPPIFIIFQLVLLIMLYSSHKDIMADKDASGNLPPMLARYNAAAFSFAMTQVALLYFYTKKMIRGGAHPLPLMKYIEGAMDPGFIVLGAFTLLYTGLLYVVLIKFITDG
jgi:hypothetical protein